MPSRSRVERMIEGGSELRPALPAEAEGPVRARWRQSAAADPGPRRVHRRQVLDLSRGRGRRPLPAELGGQSRHHDLGGAQNGGALRRDEARRESIMSREALYPGRDPARWHARHPPPLRTLIASSPSPRALDEAARRCHRNLSRRRSSGRELQLWIRQPHRPRMDWRGSRRGQPRADRRTAAAGNWHGRGPRGRLRSRCPLRAYRDPLHRGRHL